MDSINIKDVPEWKKQSNLYLNSLELYKEYGEEYDTISYPKGLYKENDNINNINDFILIHNICIGWGLY